jgi:hypothetical protein
MLIQIKCKHATNTYKVRLKEVADPVDRGSGQRASYSGILQCQDEIEATMLVQGAWFTRKEEMIMGMRVGGSSGPTATNGSTSVANWQQRQQSFQEMMSALQSGNLSGAQQAFGALGGNSNIQGNSPLAQLGQALKNGDLTGAQQAAQTLLSNRASAQNERAPNAVTPSEPSAGTSGSGSLINLTA